MADAELLAFTADALQLSLALAAPALGAGWLAGLVAALVQTAAQVHEPALAFIPRLLAVAIALAVSGTMMRDRLVAFFGELFMVVSR